MREDGGIRWTRGGVDKKGGGVVGEGEQFLFLSFSIFFSFSLFETVFRSCLLSLHKEQVDAPAREGIAPSGSWCND